MYASDRCQRISPTAPVRLQVGVSLLGDLLQVELESADWEPADLTGIIEGYRRHETYHRLQDCRFVALDDPALAGLAVVVLVADPAGLEQLTRVAAVVVLLIQHPALVVLVS